MHDEALNEIRWTNELQCFYTKSEDFAIFYDLDSIERLLTTCLKSPVHFISAIPIYWGFQFQQIRYLFSIQGTRQYIFSPVLINGAQFHGEFKILDEEDKAYCEMYFNQITKHGIHNTETVH